MSRRLLGLSAPRAIARVATITLSGLALLLGVAPAAHAWDRVVDVPLPSSGNVDTAISPINGISELRVKVLLPDGYDADPDKTWPALYLLNGAGENYSGWVDPNGGDAANLLKGLPAIVIMPEGGRSFYTDWWRGGTRKGSNWESYLLDEVIPAIESNLRITPGRQNHAIGGLSMGAYGAPALAARLPSYFGNVLVLSGMLNNQSADSLFGFMQRSASAKYSDIWGASNSPYAWIHNPMNLLSNLAGTRMYIYSGDGTADPKFGIALDQWTLGGVIEASIKSQTTAFVPKVRKLGANVTTSYRGGVHSWPYWRRELPRYVAYGPFGAPPVASSAANKNWVYRTMAQHGNAWGIGFQYQGLPDEVVTIRRTGDRIVVQGRGRIRLTTGAADADNSGGGSGCSDVTDIPAEFDIPAGC